MNKEQIEEAAKYIFSQKDKERKIGIVRYHCLDRGMVSMNEPWLCSNPDCNPCRQIANVFTEEIENLKNSLKYSDNLENLAKKIK